MLPILNTCFELSLMQINTTIGVTRLIHIDAAKMCQKKTRTHHPQNHQVSAGIVITGLLELAVVIRIMLPPQRDPAAESPGSSWSQCSPDGHARLPLGGRGTPRPKPNGSVPCCPRTYAQRR